MSLTGATHRSNLEAVMERLAKIARALSLEGRNDAAHSLETTVADLRWQCDELGGIDSSKLRQLRSRRP
jgi:hypothetical protein